MALEGLSTIDAIVTTIITGSTIINGILAKKVKNNSVDHKATQEILEIARNIDVLLQARDQKFKAIETEARAVRVGLTELYTKVNELEEYIRNGNARSEAST